MVLFVSRLIGLTVDMMKRRPKLLCQEIPFGIPGMLEFKAWSVKHPQFISDLVLAIGSNNNSGVLQEQGMVRLCPLCGGRRIFLLLSPPVCALPVILTGTGGVWGSAPLDVKVTFPGRDCIPASAQASGNDLCAEQASGRACLRSHNSICRSRGCFCRIWWICERCWAPDRGSEGWGHWLPL